MRKFSWEKIDTTGSIASQMEKNGPVKFFSINYPIFMTLLALPYFREVYQYSSNEAPLPNEVGSVGPYRYIYNSSQVEDEKEIPCIKTFLKLHHE